MRTCSICGNDSFSPLVSFGRQPLCSHLMSSQDERVPRVDNDYEYCARCCFIQRKECVPYEYQYPDYEYFSSQLFPAYVTDLAHSIVERYNDNTGLVLEIGSNDGGFLRLVKDGSSMNVFGIEPSKPLADFAQSHGIPTLNMYFNMETAKKVCVDQGIPNVIICRLVLEHIWELHEFMEALSLLSDRHTQVFIEVPNINYILENNIITGFWDQHVNYFCPASLERLFNGYGFQMKKCSFDASRAEQVILAWFVKDFTCGTRNWSETPLRLVRSFDKNVQKILSKIHECVLSLKKDGARISMYGASHNPANVVNYSHVSPFIDFAIDQIPEKWGKYIPGSSIKVESPSHLSTRHSDYCLIGAVGNEKKIISTHLEYCGAGGRFLQINNLII